MSGEGTQVTTAGEEVLIRPVRPSDAEALWHIARQPGVIETTLALPSQRLDERRQRLETLGPGDHWFVAEIDSTVVGLAGLSTGMGRTRHSGSVFVYVTPDRQGQGIGTHLLRTLLDLADNWLLLRRVELTVVVENERAKGLYERLGFVVEGRRHLSLIAQGEIKDEWLMARYR